MRIALTSGLTRRPVAADLGMGVSTLNKWIRTAQDTEDASLSDADLVREVEPLRKEVVVLKQEREILKKEDLCAVALFSSDLPISPSVLPCCHFQRA